MNQRINVFTKMVSRAIILLSLLLLGGASCFAQLSQLQKIVASDRAEYDDFSSSVSISGNYAIVGAWDEDEDATGGNTLTNAGSAYIFGYCSDTATTIDAGSDVSVNFGNAVSIFADGAGIYQWSPTEGLSCTDCASPIASPEISTLYYITLTDSNGCKTTDSIQVYVDLPCGDVFVPSAFSPNNDGVNDVLYVKGRCIQNMEFRIYDRWGELVFEAAKTSSGWDGKLKNKAMNSNVFVYCFNNGRDF